AALAVAQQVHATGIDGVVVEHERDERIDDLGVVVDRRAGGRGVLHADHQERPRNLVPHALADLHRGAATRGPADPVELRLALRHRAPLGAVRAGGRGVHRANAAQGHQQGIAVVGWYLVIVARQVLPVARRPWIARLPWDPAQL